jgi:DNA-binding SARP family transcriptional activator
VSDELRLFVCGRLVAAYQDIAISEAGLGGRQSRRLWAYLVLHRARPSGRDELGAAVWSDDLPDAWDEALNALVSRLRTFQRPIAELVPTFRIERSVGRYQLVVPAETFVDYDRARTGLHEAERRMSLADYPGAWIEAGVAVEVARRGFLPGEESAWIADLRSRLLHMHVRGLELICESDLRRGRFADAEGWARRLLEVDPLRESGYRFLMRALGGGGNRAEVIRVMAECKEILRSRLGAAPSRETEQVFREHAPSPSPR